MASRASIYAKIVKVKLETKITIYCNIQSFCLLSFLSLNLEYDS